MDVFSFDLAIKLPDNTNISKHAIKSEKDKYPLYKLISSIRTEKFKTLKTYIKNHLKTGFIKPIKSFLIASILFDKMTDSNFCYLSIINNPIT